MNWFTNSCLRASQAVCGFAFVLLLFVPLFGVSQPVSVQDDSTSRPILHKRGIIYADLDTARQRLFLVLEQGLWQYNLEQQTWRFLDSLHTLSGQLHDLEFGYNAARNRLQFWSHGVGKMYEAIPETWELRRVDRSHNHRNQHGHLAFFKEDTLFTFGGYGYWRWENIITFYNRDILEWNIQNVESGSPFPEPRAAYTGTYRAHTEKFYMYGGETPEQGRPDDQHTDKIFRTDIWRFSFPSARWKRIAELSESGFEFYTVARLNGRVSRTNIISSSIYDTHTEFWYLPVISPSKPDDMFYLRPVQLPSGTAYSPIPLHFGRSSRFIPTNFLFNEASGEAVVVGFDNLSNSDQYPINVVTISGTGLRNRITGHPLWAASTTYFIAGIAIILLLGGYLFWRRSFSSHTKQIIPPLSPEQIDEQAYFNKEEKKLLKYVFTQSRDLESQEIEELLWSDINNYDYKRRLRNDIINAINNKFNNKYRAGKLIVRQKDPDDKRRYLYGLNEELIRR